MTDVFDASFKMGKSSRGVNVRIVHGLFHVVQVLNVERLVWLSLWPSTHFSLDFSFNVCFCSL